jgi:maleylpyruvate isomerase
MGGMQTVEEAIKELGTATDSLVDGIGRLTDADVRGPSLLPGWTRGHVLTHLARNADGGTRLLGWARTGIASYEYQSVAARAEAIEEGAGRPAVVLLADVSAASAAFAEAVAVMPPECWQHLITWTTGQQEPAGGVVRSRLAEVLIHHLDLDLGFGPGCWPPWFVREMLARAVSSMNERQLAPVPALLHAADTGHVCQLGSDAPGAIQISGTEADLLAWVLGRSDGARLRQDRPGPLPIMPSIYYT